MRQLQRAWARVSGTLKNEQYEEDLAREINTHLTFLREKYEDEGMTPREALIAAQTACGGIEQAKQLHREERSYQGVLAVSQDLRFAIRSLRKTPGFTWTCALTLALGIGASSAIFSLMYAVLIKPLPFPASKQIVQVTPLTFQPGSGTTAGAGDDISWPNFFDWRQSASSFSHLAAYHTGTLTLAPIGANPAAQMRVATVSSGFFSVLGVQPERGRTFTPDEERIGNRAVVLSHDVWSTMYGASDNIIGKSLTLDGLSYAIAGVMPKGFAFPEVVPRVEIWRSLAPEAEGANPPTEQRDRREMEVIGRLRPGVSMQTASAEINVIQRNLAERYPSDDAQTLAAVIEPELTHVVGEVGPALRVLFAAVAGILLIACANVAGLLLARGKTRQHELAVRTALGATPDRIVYLLLIESLLLSLLGGATGLLLAVGLLKAAIQIIPANMPRIDHVSINWPVIAVTFFISLLTGVLFGLLPALRSAHADPANAMREQGRTSITTRSSHRLHSILVVSETALAVVLLIVAGLLAKSFLHVIEVKPGFDPSHTLTFSVGIPQKDYTVERRSQLYSQLLERLNSLPGVEAVSAAFPLPFNGNDMDIGFQIDGHETNSAHEPTTSISLVTPDFFKTMRIPKLSGHSFEPQDNLPNGRPIVIVNQAFVDKFFGQENALGKQIRLDPGDGSSQPWREITGVVGDTKQGSLTESPLPMAYLQYAQLPATPLSFVMRVAQDPTQYESSVISVVASLDSSLPVYRLRSYAEYLSIATSQARFQAVILGGFAVIALLLSAVGLYAVLSFIVTERTSEIGLRMALGAERWRIVRLFVAHGCGLAALGLVVGCISAALLTGFMAHLLYGVRPLDIETFGIASAVLFGTALLATLIPAWRAASIDPMKALKNT
jgi:putative ABC transport system permease protein